MTLRELISQVTDGHMDLSEPFVELDYPILMKENGEYGSYSIIPMTRAYVDSKTDNIIIED